MEENGKSKKFPCDMDKGKSPLEEGMEAEGKREKGKKQKDVWVWPKKNLRPGRMAETPLAGMGWLRL